MPVQVRHVVLDVDSTVFPLLNVMGSLPGGEKVSYDSVFSWDGLADRCDGTDRMLAMFGMAFERMLDWPAFPGASAELHRLHEQGVRFHVITDRPARFETLTRQWLSAADIPVESVWVGDRPDKLAMARTIGAEMIVDDHPKLQARCAAEGFPICSLRWNYNAAVLDEHGLGWATNWADLADVVAAELKLPVPADTV